MKVLNFDVNGRSIADLSKVNLPEEFGRFVYQIRIDAAKRMKSDQSHLYMKNSNGKETKA